MKSHNILAEIRDGWGFGVNMEINNAADDDDDHNIGPVGNAEFSDRSRHSGQGCQIAKFDPSLSLDCARVEDVGRNPRKGRDQILQRSVEEP